MIKHQGRQHPLYFLLIKMGQGEGTGEGWGKGEGTGSFGHGNEVREWNHGLCSSCSPCGTCKS